MQFKHVRHLTLEIEYVYHKASNLCAASVLNALSFVLGERMVVEKRLDRYIGNMLSTTNESLSKVQLCLSGVLSRGQYTYVPEW